MHIGTHYTVYYEHIFGGLCSKSAGSFDAACDLYERRRNAGAEATVFRVEPPLPRGCKCGIMLDITADAEERIRNRYRQKRGYVMPAWLREVA